MGTIDRYKVVKTELCNCIPSSGHKFSRTAAARQRSLDALL